MGHEGERTANTKTKTFLEVRRRLKGLTQDSSEARLQTEAAESKFVNQLSTQENSSTKPVLPLVSQNQVARR